MSTVPEAERTQPVPTVPPDARDTGSRDTTSDATSDTTSDTTGDTTGDTARTNPHAVSGRTTRTTATVSGQAEQRRRFGGIRWGSAFFGWLTASGMAVLLTALAAGIGAAAGLAVPGGPAGALDAATRDPATARTVGIAGAVVLLAVLFVAYFCGGYVAGRMARFAGAKQGAAVWLWALVVAVLAAVAASVAGLQFDALANVGGLPPMPLAGGELTTAGVATGLAALAASLVGAVLGGLAGMRYHRRVDRETAEPV